MAIGMRERVTDVEKFNVILWSCNVKACQRRGPKPISCKGGLTSSGGAGARLDD